MKKPNFIHMLAMNNPGVVGPSKPQSYGGGEAPFPPPVGVGSSLSGCINIVDIASPSDLANQYPNGLLPPQPDAAMCIVEYGLGGRGYFIQYDSNGLQSFRIREGDALPVAKGMKLVAGPNAVGAIQLSYWDWPSGFIRSTKHPSLIELVNSGSSSSLVTTQLEAPEDWTDYVRHLWLVKISGLSTNANWVASFVPEPFSPDLLTDIGGFNVSAQREDFTPSASVAAAVVGPETRYMEIGRGQGHSDREINGLSNGQTSIGNTARSFPYGGLLFVAANIISINIQWWHYAVPG